MRRKSAATNTAVTFASDKLGRSPTLLARQPQTNELANGVNVFLYAVELAGLGKIFWTTETRAYWINKYKISCVKN